MISPMTKENIDRVKNGQLKQAVIPVAVPGDLKAGDQVTFQEADFDLHQIPTFKSGGDSVTVTLTKATSSGQPYGTATLFSIEWA